MKSLRFESMALFLTYIALGVSLSWSSSVLAEEEGCRQISRTKLRGFVGTLTSHLRPRPAGGWLGVGTPEGADGAVLLTISPEGQVVERAQLRGSAHRNVVAIPYGKGYAVSWRDSNNEPWTAVYAQNGRLTASPRKLGSPEGYGRVGLVATRRGKLLVAWAVLDGEIWATLLDSRGRQVRKRWVLARIPIAHLATCELQNNGKQISLVVEEYYAIDHTTGFRWLSITPRYRVKPYARAKSSGAGLSGTFEIGIDGPAWDETLEGLPRNISGPLLVPTPTGFLLTGYHGALPSALSPGKYTSRGRVVVAVDSNGNVLHQLDAAMEPGAEAVGVASVGGTGVVVSVANGWLVETRCPFNPTKR